VIAMTKDLNPPTSFLFPGVGEQASLAMAARAPDPRVIKDRTTWRGPVSLSAGSRHLFSNSQCEEART
jgi:hypothetical protein